MNGLLVCGTALALVTSLPASAIAARCTDVTDTPLFRFAGEPLVAHSATAVPGSLGREEIYDAGQTTQVLVAVALDRSTRGLPLVPGMPQETLDPPVPVEVQVLDVEGERTLLCTVSRNLNGNGAIILRVDANRPTQHLAVRYSAASLPPRARLVARVDSHLESLSERFPPVCREVDEAALQAAFVFREADRVRIDPGESCRQRLVVRSSHDLLLSVRDGAGAKITASFKPANSYAPFARFCEAAMGIRSQENYVVGLNPSLPILRDGPQLWAIDVDAACPAGPTVEIKIREVISGGVYKGEEQLPVARPYGTPAYLTDLRLSCFSDLRSLAAIMVLDSGRRRRPAAGKGFLELSVLRRTGELQPHERMSVEKAVLYALAAWSRACLNCEAHTLALARVNGQLFISSLLIEELLGVVPKPASSSMLAARDVAVDEWSSNVASSLRARVPAYLRAAPRDLKNLCASKILEQVLGAGAKCEADIPVFSETPSLRLQILLTEGFTSCDSNPNTIACEQDGEQIELNIRDYTYAVDSSGEVAFGRGKRRVSLDAVMAHEIGHWLGLSHVNGVDALMSPTTEKARCIGNTDVEALLRRGPGIGPAGRYTFNYR